jgi:hypothetical protein
VVGIVSTWLFVGMVAVGLVGQAAAPVDVTGKWRMALEMEMGRATPLLDLTQSGSKITGTYTGRYGSSPVSGEIEGKALRFSVAMETTSLLFKGELKDDGTLAGTADFGEIGAVAWTAAREKQ